MAEAFKEMLSMDKVMGLAISVQELAPHFSVERYSSILKKQDWDALSLMERLRAAAESMGEQLQGRTDAERLVEVLNQNEELSGWLSLICCEFVARDSSLSTEEGLQYLAQMTGHFSAEFAIRSFIQKDLATCLRLFENWIEHEDQHIRRLVSEGSRPRLPWGIRLQEFVEDPSPMIPLLDRLKDDPEEYVRRSVANHLNDIAKDHPEVVIELAQQWLAESTSDNAKTRLKLVRHACRTLFKQGNPAALAMFGYGDVSEIGCNIEVANNQIAWLGNLEFSIALNNANNLKTTDKLMVDYVVHFQKANGKLAPKVFKWMDKDLGKNAVSNSERFSKTHSFKTVTTRKHYPGIHRIEVMINGVKKAEAEFTLLSQE